MISEKARLLSSVWPPSAQHAYAAAVAMILSDLGQQAARVLVIDDSSMLLHSALAKQQMTTEAIKLSAFEQPMGLPFEAGAFAAVCAVEGKQPVETLQTMLPESRRMLRKDGVFFYGVDELVAADVYLNMGVGWQTILRRHAIKPLPMPEVRVREKCNEMFRQSDAALEALTICRWSEAITPRQRLDTIDITALDTTDDLKMRCQRDYERWLKTQYFDLDTSLEVQRECHLQIWRWA